MEEFIKKLRGLPERNKKIILWGVTVLTGILLLVWWIPKVGNDIRDLREIDYREELAIPELEKELQGIPDIVFPAVDTKEETASSSDELKSQEPEL